MDPSFIYPASPIREEPFTLKLPARPSAAPTQLNFVPISGGTFWMGQKRSETLLLKQAVGETNFKNWYARELPRHQVTIPTFWMSQYPITQAQYEAVMGENPATGKAWCLSGKEWKPDQQIPEHFVHPQKPVVAVSWDMAVEFCLTLSQKLGGYSISLPTEAEWEYACRAGQQTAFSCGGKITPEDANFDGRHTYNNSPQGTYRKTTTIVGEFPPNAWGLYDMHGNVWEWCLDQFYQDYSAKPDRLKQDGSIAWNKENTFITPEIDFRLLRGGSWYCLPRYCRSAFRNRSNPLTRNLNHGFRVVYRGARI